jgi:hypothetical protein
VINWLDSIGLYPLFSEGWALYAENPLIALESDAYENNPLQKYGMLKWQIWRALRLIVDTGLHYKGNLESQSVGRTLQQIDLFLLLGNSMQTYIIDLNYLLSWFVHEIVGSSSRVYCIFARATNS